MPQPLRMQTDRSSADRLMDAAEALIGQHGVDGVSLRQIGSAANSGNNYAVQYHFGDAAGLVRAILVERMSRVEAGQAAVLQRVQDQPRARTRALLEVLLRPILELRNGEGARVYARFIVALLNSGAGVAHFRTLLDLAPSADRVVALLRAEHPDIPLPTLSERLRVLAMMVLSSAFNRLDPFSVGDFDAELVDDALDMAAAALSVPVCDGLKTLIGDASA